MGYIIGCRHYTDSATSSIPSLHQLSTEPVKQKVYHFYYAKPITVGSRVLVSTKHGLKFAKVDYCKLVGDVDHTKLSNVLCIITNSNIDACMKKSNESLSMTNRDFNEQLYSMVAENNLEVLLDEFNFVHPKVIHGDLEALLRSKILVDGMLTKIVSLKNDIEQSIHASFKTKDYTYCPNCGGVCGQTDALDAMRQYTCYECGLKWEIPNNDIC
jgi:predicted RNA-binding Zn-ribbon protein involved in translation (DUF1610 family)